MGYVTLALFDRMTLIVQESIQQVNEDICRLCGERESSLWNLFEACDDNGNLNLAEKIFTCLNIMVEIGDGLPDQICGKCMTVVRCFSEFRQQCLSQDAMLRKSLSVISSHKSPNAENAFSESLVQEWNNRQLLPSQQCLEEGQTPELVHQLEEEWAEDISTMDAMDLRREQEAPWRLNIESLTERNEDTIERTTCFDTIDANGNMDPLCLSEKSEASANCCSNLSINFGDLDSEMAFLSPGTITGDIILINKTDSETESIDIESIEDAEHRKETDQANFEEIFAGRISRNQAGLWVCNICGKANKTINKLKEHISGHYSGLGYQCVECEAFFETSEALDLHQTHHFTSCLVLGHTCNHCYKSFRLKHLLAKHLTAEHVSENKPKSGTKKFRETCGGCARVFYSSFEMENHDESCEDLVFESDEDSSDESFSSAPSQGNEKKNLNLCRICKLSFESARQVVLHFKLSHKNDVPFKCDVLGCLKTFKTAHSFRCHETIHNPTFSCSVCKKFFYHKGKFNDHLRIHSGEKPFDCLLCDKSFSSAKRLTNHEMHHFKQYKCELCGLVFGTKFNLDRHTAIHTGSKPQFICEICGVIFNDKSCLQKHNLYHHQLNLQCTVCKKTFYSQTSFAEHQLLRNKGGPFPCIICSQEFCTWDSLIQHTIELHRS